jgi:hypothetical protein
MRFLLLSIEFDAGTFSGNGVYACSQVMGAAGAPPVAGCRAPLPPPLLTLLLPQPLLPALCRRGPCLNWATR